MAGSTTFKTGRSFALNGPLVMHPSSKRGRHLHGGLVSRTGIVLGSAAIVLSGGSPSALPLYCNNTAVFCNNTTVNCNATTYTP